MGHIVALFRLFRLLADQIPQIPLPHRRFPVLPGMIAFPHHPAFEPPAIPAVKSFADFRAFSQAGRDLAHWHLNYETVACHPGVAVACGKEEGPYCPSSAGEEATVRSPLLTPGAFRVTKMKFDKSVNDKGTVIYNEFITLRNIPLPTAV